MVTNIYADVFLSSIYRLFYNDSLFSPHILYRIVYLFILSAFQSACYKGGLKKIRTDKKTVFCMMVYVNLFLKHQKYTKLFVSATASRYRITSIMNESI